MEQKINRLFEAYEDFYNGALSSGKPEVDKIADSFASCIFASDPNGINCGKNDKEFKENIEKGFHFYKSIGTKSMTITDKQITFLNHMHAITKVKWTSKVIKKDSSELAIDFEVIYFLKKDNDQVKIFGYVSEDEQKVYEELGIDPYL